MNRDLPPRDEPQLSQSSFIVKDRRLRQKRTSGVASLTNWTCAWDGMDAHGACTVDEGAGWGGFS
eukprot:6474633-Pyramimonas_sp.AAC.1